MPHSGEHYLESPVGTNVALDDYADKLWVQPAGAVISRNPSGKPQFGDIRDAFFADQMQTWPDLRTRHAALARRELVTVQAGKSTVYIQFNEGRKARTGKAGGGPITEDNCFLEAHNFAPQERCIPVDENGKYVLAFNPFPCGPDHTVTMRTTHTPQRFATAKEALFIEAEGSDDEHIGAYNGEKAGASNGPHEHIQGLRQKTVPLELHLPLDNPLHQSAHSTVYLPHGLLQTVIVIEARELDALRDTIDATVGRLPIPAGEQEPPLNAAIRHLKDTFRVYIFPRSHAMTTAEFEVRQEDGSYRTEEHTITPAFVEALGTLVLPFTARNITPETVASIYRDTWQAHGDIRDCLNGTTRIAA